MPRPVRATIIKARNGVAGTMSRGQAITNAGWRRLQIAWTLAAFALLAAIVLAVPVFA